MYCKSHLGIVGYVIWNQILSLTLLPKNPFKLINFGDFSYVFLWIFVKNILDLSFWYNNEQIKSTISIGWDFYLCPDTIQSKSIAPLFKPLDESQPKIIGGGWFTLHHLINDCACIWLVFDRDISCPKIIFN